MQLFFKKLLRLADNANSGTVTTLIPGLPLARQKKIWLFQRNCSQHIQQMHIYYYKICLLWSFSCFSALT